MHADLRAYLNHIEDALEKAALFTADLSEVEYESNTLVKAAVERQFMIVGEALNRIAREFPEVMHFFPEASRIIGFRNVLVHSYDVIDDAIVWDAVKEKSPQIRAAVQSLRKEAEAH